MNKNDIVCLEISSWRGISIGAMHYYGKIVGYKDNEYHHATLTRKLSAYVAAEMNRHHRKEFPYEHDPYRYRAGQTTECFDTRQQIISLAKRCWLTHFPKAHVLMLGSFSVANPQQILIAPADFKKKVNDLWREDERIGGYEGNPKRSEEIYREYQAYINGYRFAPARVDRRPAARPGGGCGRGDL